MASHYSTGTWLVWLSLFLALTLDILPLPLFLLKGKPEMVLLMLIFWVLYEPRLLGIGVAFLLGLFVDVLYGSLLGQHALSMSLVIWLCLRLVQRVQMWRPVQQAIFVFIMAGIYQTLNQWLTGMHEITTTGLWYLLPALVSGLLWPAFAYFMQQLALGAQVNAR